MIEFHKPPFELREFKIEVTSRCNLACIHCSSDAIISSTQEMTEESCSRIINEAVAMGVEKVAFSGGEPLLWEPLRNLVGLARRGGMDVSVYTSGNVDDIKTKLSSLKDGGVRRIVFSLFGGLRKTHDKVTRVRGSFNITLKAIEDANGLGFETEVHFVPLAFNYKEIRGIATLGTDIGLTRVSVLRFVPQGRGTLLKGCILDKLQNLELRRIIESLRREGYEIRTGSPFNFLLLNDQPECCAGIDRIIISPDLRLYPCDAFKQIKAEELVGTLEYSSLENTALEECWVKSPFLKSIREYLTTPFGEPCGSCEVLLKCLSGCLAQKVLACGNLEKNPDPDCLMA